jgi:ribosomal-protein-alanine N-acetyltransferase
VKTLHAGPCLLEPQVAAHAAEMFAVLADPAIYELEGSPPRTQEWLEHRFAKLESRASPDGAEVWLNWVVRLPTGALAGYVQATITRDGTAHIAYVLASKHWRQGIGSAAVGAMLAELAATHRVRYVAATLKATNHPSLGLLQKLGFDSRAPRARPAVAREADEVVMYKALAADDNAAMSDAPVRVTLQSPSLRHAAAFTAAVLRSRRLHRGWTSPPATREAYQAFVLRSRKKNQACHVVLTESGELAGVINISEIVKGAFCSGYLGYYAFVPHDGQGYLRAGLAAVLRLAFQEYGLHRVEANIQPKNRRSIALVQGLGFSLEGYSPRYLKIGGRWRDHERWALTVEAWKAPRRKRAVVR